MWIVFRWRPEVASRSGCNYSAYLSLWQSDHISQQHYAQNLAVKYEERLPGATLIWLMFIVLLFLLLGGTLISLLIQIGVSAATWAATQARYAAKQELNWLYQLWGRFIYSLIQNGVICIPANRSLPSGPCAWMNVHKD